MPTSHVDDLYRADGDDAVVIHVHVQPGAGRASVVGRHGNALKVRVGAAPEGGRANEATAELLAQTFGLERAAVELLSGPSSRAKQFRLAGVDLEAFRTRLERAAAGAGAGPEARQPRS